jgi:hypothetical protein
MPQAKRAAEFLRTLGMNVHVTQGGQYDNITQMITDLNYVGFKLLRDNITSNSGDIAQMDQLAAAGCRWDFIGSGTPSSTVSFIKAFQTRNPGKLNSVEGPNEPNNFPISYGGQTGTNAGILFTNDLVTAVRADSSLSAVKIYNTSPYPHVSTNADYGNTHYYSPAGAQADSDLVANVNLEKSAMPNKPQVLTETGYFSLPGYHNGQWIGVTEDAQCRLLLNEAFRAYEMGLAETYFYQLYDQFPPSDGTNEAFYGIIRNDGTRKQAAVGFHNVTTILADNGATALTFTPGTVNYTITGLPSTGHSILFQTSAGVYKLVVWAMPNIWNTTTDTQIDAPIVSFTVNFGATFASVKVYDLMDDVPLELTATNVSSITHTVDDHPMVVEFSNPGATLPAGQATVPINVGALANDGTGDALRTAFQTVNSNFSKVDARLAAIESLLNGG